MGAIYSHIRSDHFLSLFLHFRLTGATSTTTSAQQRLSLIGVRARGCGGARNYVGPYHAHPSSVDSAPVGRGAGQRDATSGPQRSAGSDVGPASVMTGGAVDPRREIPLYQALHACRRPFGGLIHQGELSARSRARPVAASPRTRTRGRTSVLHVRP